MSRFSVIANLWKLVLHSTGQAMVKFLYLYWFNR